MIAGLAGSHEAVVSYTSDMRVQSSIIVALWMVIGLTGWAGAQENPEPPTTQTTSTPTTVDQPKRLRAPGDRAVVIELDGDVDDFMHRALVRQMQQARDLGVDTVILEIRTYGGLVQTALEISRFIKQQDDLYIIVYVKDRAISAGAMISVAADEIVMEPHSQIGDSGVIAAGPSGVQELDPHTRAKFESPVLEDFYDSAIRNGYDPLLLQAMVTVDRAVYWLEHVQSAERRFVGQDEYDKLVETVEPANRQWKPVLPERNPIDARDTLLMLSSDLAEKVGLSTGTFASMQAFAADRGIEIVTRLAPTTGERLVGWLGSMTVRSLLMTVLLFSLYMSFSSPGQGLPEAVAGISLTVLMVVPLMSGYAQWYEVVAVVVGLTLIALELFVLPGFGLPGITGLILVLAGLTMTFVPPIKLPGLPVGFGISLDAVRDALIAVVSALLASLLLWWWLSRYLPKLPYLGGLVLGQTAGDVVTVGGGAGESTGGTAPVLWPPKGMIGTVVTDLRPGGLAEFADETTNETRTIDVVCDGGYVTRGARVVVRDVSAARIVVRPLKD